MTGKRGWRTSCASTVNMGRGSYSRSVKSLSLDPTEGDPFHELSLKNEEQNQYRNGRHVCGGHQERVVREVLPLQHGDADREDAYFGVVGHDQRPKELVPRIEHDQKGEGRKRRPRQRQMDLPVDLEGVGAFDG